MKSSVIGVLIFLAFIFFSNPCSSEEIINIATENYPPHTSPNLKYYGLNCRIVTEAFALAGITVKYTFLPGKRAFMSAKHGTFDGAVPWVWRKERAKHFYFPDPVFTAGRDSFFHLKSFKFNWNPEKPDYTKLKGITIGAIIGHNYGKSFQEAEKSGLIQVERVATTIQAFKLILSGRIQVSLVEDSVGYYELQTNFSQEKIDLITHTLKNTLPADNYHLIISKKSKKGKYFLKTFNEGLKKLKKSGKLDQFAKESIQGNYIINELKTH